MVLDGPYCQKTGYRTVLPDRLPAGRYDLRRSPAPFVAQLSNPCYLRVHDNTLQRGKVKVEGQCSCPANCPAGVHAKPGWAQDRIRKEGGDALAGIPGKVRVSFAPACCPRRSRALEHPENQAVHRGATRTWNDLPPRRGRAASGPSILILHENKDPIYCCFGGVSTFSRDITH